MLQVHPATHTPIITHPHTVSVSLQLTCAPERQPGPMAFGPSGLCDQSGSGSGRAAHPLPQCGRCRPGGGKGDSPYDITCY